MRTRIYILVTGGIDILTDILLISIPLALLWSVKIPRHRKFSLGFFLCLSICMVITVIIRLAGAKIVNDVTDSIWVSFWLGAESGVSYITISLITLRSLVGKENGQRGKSSKSRSRNFIAKFSRFWRRGVTGTGEPHEFPKSPLPANAGELSPGEKTICGNIKAPALEKPFELDAFEHDLHSAKIV